MFNYDVNTMQITLHRGNTGTVPFKITGHDFTGETAVAYFCMKQGSTVVKEGYYPLDSTGEFTVEFVNTDTDGLAPGTYEYDVHVVLDPVYDDNDNVVDGTFVRTMMDPIPIIVKRTVGTV